VPFQLYSAENWRFAAKHFIKKHPEDVAVHLGATQQLEPLMELM